MDTLESRAVQRWGGLRFARARAVYAEGFRAPNIGDRFVNVFCSRQLKSKFKVPKTPAAITSLRLEKIRRLRENIDVECIVSTK